MDTITRLAALYRYAHPFLYAKNAADSSKRVTVSLINWKRIPDLQVLPDLSDIENIAGNALVLRNYALNFFNTSRSEVTFEKFGRPAQLSEIRLCFKPIIEPRAITAVFLDDIKLDQLSIIGPYSVAVETSKDNFHVHFALSRPITADDARGILRYFAKTLGLGDVGALGLEQPRRMPQVGLRTMTHDRSLEVEELLVKVSEAKTYERVEITTEDDWRTKPGPIPHLQNYWNTVAKGAPRKSDHVTPDYSWVDFIVCRNKASEGYTDEAIYDALSQVVRPDGRTFRDKYDSDDLCAEYIMRMTAKARRPASIDLRAKL